MSPSGLLVRAWRFCTRGKNRMEPPARQAQILTELQHASAGLTYPSESDEPFDPFCWHEPGPSDSVEQHLIARVGRGRRIETVAFDGFFAKLERSDDAARFRQLRSKLVSLLSELQVFRVGAGEVEVDVYVVGRAAGGDLAGLHTRSIET